MQEYIKILDYDKECDAAISGITFLLSVYEPEHCNNKQILTLNRMLNNVSLDNLDAISDIDLHNTDLFKSAVEVIQSLGSQFRIERSQIFKSNSIDLNCRRHKKIFDEKKIIPSYCFSCFKVQVDVSSNSDLVRLYAYFSCVDFPNGNIRKTMVELRNEFPGFYKGLVYSRDLDDAGAICKKMQKDLSEILNFKFTCAIKRGCSEFPIAYPKFKDISTTGIESFNIHPQQEVENAFDARVGPTPVSFSHKYL